jgi:glutathione S-transferase
VSEKGWWFFRGYHQPHRSYFMTTLRVFTFAPDWGLPTVGPFALKLLSWLELAGIPYEQVVEGNPRKGPKGKNPWIELEGERIGDSEVIIDLLTRRHGVNLDEGLTPEQIAMGHAWRRTFEEHFHQVLEWELFFHPAGAAWMQASLASQMPPVVGRLLFPLMRSHFGRQLYARGIARHAPEIIAQKGRADLDALSAFLSDRPFLLADRPTTADTAVFGLLAPVVSWTMDTPVAAYARSVPNLVAYCRRMQERCFGNKETALQSGSQTPKGQARAA